MKTPRVVYWDIDGTLIRGNGAGVEAWLRAWKDCFDSDVTIDGIRWAGRTDPYISLLFFEKMGMEEDRQQVSRFLDRYVDFLPEELERAEGSLLPGISGILNRVQAIPGLDQGLLTGNVERGARTKLRFFEIWDHFAFGSFADGVYDRDELAPVALELARKHVDPRLRGEDLLVVGDTPFDVQCGKVIGAQTLAVATGYAPRESLEEAAPDWLLDDLSDVDGFFRLIGR